MATRKNANSQNSDKTPRRSARAASTRRRREFPNLIAGIDIGSTAIRMKVAELLADSELRVLEDLNYPAATGADTFSHGYILPETLHAITRILQDFTRLLEGYGEVRCRAVSSASVREASNSEILVDRVSHDAGLKLEILDAVEESRLVYQALLPWLMQHPGAYSLALNLGGGSTEIMLLRGIDLQIGGARRLGTSRLFHAVAKGSTQAKSELLKAITANIVYSARDVYQEYNAARFYLINRMLYRAFQDDPLAVKNERDYVIPTEALRQRLKNAYTLGNLEIGERFNLGLADVELLVPAMLILDCFLEASEIKEVTFANTDMLAGLLTEMAMTTRGEKPLMSFHRQIVRSARAVGEKYAYDRAHSRAVTEFSLRLFDALTEVLDLDVEDRLILEVAAVLHDIGMYIAEIHHQRHSAYLLRWADIVGLSEHDRTLASQIVYFHRKDIPSTRHAEFMALPLEDRMRVRKLAGILRLGDVLDRGHRQSIKNIRVEIADEKLYLYLETAIELGLITDALAKKANLIEMVTGFEVVLRREIAT